MFAQHIRIQAVLIKDLTGPSSQVHSPALLYGIQTHSPYQPSGAHMASSDRLDDLLIQSLS